MAKASVDDWSWRPVGRNILIALVAITCLGAAARFFRIEDRALHRDEALQMNGVQTQTFADLIRHCTNVDFHPPLSYLVQKAFYRVRASTGSVRCASAVFGTLMVPLVFWAFFPLFRVRASLITCGLAAMSYSFIWYSREARDYIFFMFFVVAAFGVFVRILRHEETTIPWRNLVGFALINIVSVYAHYNTFLIWPIYAVVFVAWEINRGWRSFRFRLLWCLAAVGIVVLVGVIPAFILIFQWDRVTGLQPMRPSPLVAWREVASMGFGRGWRGWLWAALLIVGCWRAWRLDRRAAIVMIAWIVVPMLGYLYIKGMPKKYVETLNRYQIYMQVGLLGLLALGVEQVGLLIGRQRERRVNAVCALTAVLTVVVMAGPFKAYYSLAASGRLFQQMGGTLSELGERSVMIDNYYELQYLRHYLTARSHIAHPPVFGGPKEFQRLQVSAFLRREAAADPMMVYYDSGARQYAATGTSWDWLEERYSHRLKLRNIEGSYLYLLGLNLFPLRNLDKKEERIYWNEVRDLPELFRERGQTVGIAFGPTHHNLTACNLQNEWQLHRVIVGEDVVHVVNTSTRTLRTDLVLKLSGCEAGQQVTIRLPDGRAMRTRLDNGPVKGVDFRSRKSFAQYIALGEIFTRARSPVNLPAALAFDFRHVELASVALEPGVNVLALQCPSPAGFVLGGVTVGATRSASD